jgi:hypothetical protein
MLKRTRSSAKLCVKNGKTMWGRFYEKLWTPTNSFQLKKALTVELPSGPALLLRSPDLVTLATDRGAPFSPAINDSVPSLLL